MSEKRNQHLACVLKSHNIENNEDLMKAYRKKRDEIREAIKKKYGSRIYWVLHSGSYKKFTAINIKFDMDLVIPFKKEEAETLKELFAEIRLFFDEYKKTDPTLIEVKSQKIAIGLTFKIDEDTLDLDIVPGREINDYDKDDELNVYVNSQMGLTAAGTSLKTNIAAQIQYVKDNADAREIIKLLKVYKRRNPGKVDKFKSIALELITIKALSNYKGTSDLWSKLRNTLVYIKDNIQTVTLIDPGNSNNRISDAITELDKITISTNINFLLMALDASEDSIKVNFPINSEYPCEDEKRNAYVIGSVSRSDRLKQNDFGGR
jgi:hypothetical protein